MGALITNDMVVLSQTYGLKSISFFTSSVSGALGGLNTPPSNTPSWNGSHVSCSFVTESSFWTIEVDVDGNSVFIKGNSELELYELGGGWTMINGGISEDVYLLTNTYNPSTDNHFWPVVSKSETVSTTVTMSAVDLNNNQPTSTTSNYFAGYNFVSSAVLVRSNG